MPDQIRFAIEVLIRAAILLAVLRVVTGKGQCDTTKCIVVAIVLALCSGLFGLWIQLWYIPLMFVLTPVVLHFLIPLPWGKSILVTVIYIAAKAAVSYIDWQFFRN
jgi:hypothetical protein